MLTFLPQGSANSRVDELLASAPSRYEIEALAIKRYEETVVAYRVYLPIPHYDDRPSDLTETDAKRGLRDESAA